MNEMRTTPPGAGGPMRASAEPVTLSWTPPKGMVALCFINFVLRILTLGIYHFWGKTEVRRRIWSAIRLNGEPLAYTGTGMELFLGFVIVFGAILLPAILLAYGAVLVFGPGSPMPALLQVVVYAAFFFLLGIGIHRAQRYRLARTRWRGIRGGLEGGSLGYAWTYFWTGLLIPLTLGWIVPWRSTRLQGLISNGMRFGDRPFRFSAPSGPLYSRFAILWLAAVVIMFVASSIIGVLMALVFRPEDFQPDAPPGMPRMAALLAIVYAVTFVGFLVYGIFSAWYRAGMMNHFAAHTTFEGASFRGSATAGSLMWLTVSNYLMVLFDARPLVAAGAGALRPLFRRAHIDRGRGAARPDRPAGG